MKIALGSRPYDGAMGGGNRFVRSLAERLAAAGHAVVHDLDHDDIDVILMIDPRTRSPNVCFGAGAVLRHLLLRNRDAAVVHCINECDERKNERFINHRLVRANYARRRYRFRWRLAGGAAGVANAPAQALARDPQRRGHQESGVGPSGWTVLAA